MKKLGLVAVAFVMVAGVAFAASLNVPFFGDGGAAVAGNSGSGAETYIGLSNTTGSAVTLTLAYRGLDGSNRGGGTFNLGANTAVSFRPFANDPDEGTGAAVPNMSAGAANGSLTVSWSGSTGDITGRVAGRFNGEATGNYGLNLDAQP